MQEEWKVIAESDGMYEVSNFGRVRSMHGHKEWKYLKGTDNGLGYLRVNIFSADGIKRYFYVHRLVATAFIDNPEGKPCVNHLDNNPSNNIFYNLEWCTKQENTDWMVLQGRNKRTPEWRAKMWESLKKTYRPVIGTNIETGEQLFFDHLNAVRDYGFSPGNVCVCCKHKAEQYRGYRWEYAQKNKGNRNKRQGKAKRISS